MENNPQAVTDWNLISIPFNLTIFEIYNGTNMGYNPVVRPYNCIRAIWRYNNFSYGWEKNNYNGSVWLPANGDENFTILETGRSYWFEVNQSCNLTFVGTVPTENITIPLNVSWNLAGWYSVNISVLPTYGADPYPIDVDLTNSVKAIDRYNPITDKFEVTIHYDDWGWWPSSNNKGFTTIEPDRGYYFDVIANIQWEHDPHR